ncbi:putative late blight resistance protein homolog R1A-10 [Salvia hispanica]|uniref:putative late blight resistance protein homolog R1A-10 n=1 Tax=Salvia hispanica TaxID=49212 RepID=UPI002009011C|nr:putative late blight resistance protein homolog R1A-10 [Salvia hispanica]
MVGFDGVMLQLMDKLTDGEPGRQVIPIVGMGGIGKTTLARNVYEKPLISHHFDICAWVTISQQFNSKELLCEILSQANKQGKEALSQMSEDEIGVALHKYLSYRRFFIVLDDMWSVEAWEKLQRYFPDNSNGSRIMVTTRLSNLGSQLDRNDGLKMKFLDEESSWNMFCKIVFGGRSCPLELEKIGRKIVESCRGLPLSIVVMGGLLGKLDTTKECWESIRGSINSLVNLENDNHCLKILKLSYNHLPVYLKPCFLYMGMYEEDRAIRVSTVIKLWVSEGFLKPIRGKSLEIVAKEYLDELVDRNLILVHEFGKTGKMKYLKIHDLLRDLCLREAEKESKTVGIWLMPQLRHVCFWILGGLHLPDPPSDNIVIMENLQTLKGVRNFKCDEMMKLESFSCQCFGAGADVFPKITFPRSLKSLTLEMYTKSRVEDILEKLKASSLVSKFYHFTIVDCKAGLWRAPPTSHFSSASILFLWKDLKEIPAELGEIPTLKSVVLSECNESAVKSAKRMVEEQEELQGEDQLSFKVTDK